MVGPSEHQPQAPWCCCYITTVQGALFKIGGKVQFKGFFFFSRSEMSSRSLFYTEQQALENGLDIQIIGMKNKILKKSFSLD